MKRYGNLFDKIADIDNIRLAHKNASRGKKKYKEVQMVNTDVDMYCENIRDMLISGTYTTSEYTVKTKQDKGKLREIHVLPYYPDRIVHHAIMQILESIWKRTLIADTYQSIKGRGLHKCIDKIDKYVRYSKGVYYLQVDIAKFYPSINNEIMKQVLRKKIKCSSTLELLDNIVDSCVGMPIGNYLSQYLGNLYLSELDHLVKERYKIKQYYRYCDDIVVLSKDKAELWYILEQMQQWCSCAKLRIKSRVVVAEVTDKVALDFLGYCSYVSKRLIRKRIRSRVSKATHNGWLCKCDCNNLKESR